MLPNTAGPGFLSFIFSDSNPNDEVKIPSKTKLDELNQETGMDRLRKMFTLDQYGQSSKELTMIGQAGLLSSFGGFVIGAVISSREAFINFMENNTATKFASHLDAKRKLSRAMYLAISKGGFGMAWRIGLFSTSFTSFMTTMAVYRGRESVIDYVIAGAATGGVFKMRLGPKGIVAGSALGGALGGICGTVSVLISMITGVSMNDVQDFSKAMSEARREAILKSSKEHMKNEGFVDAPGNEDQFVNLNVDTEKK